MAPDRRPIRAPRVSGVPLRALVLAAEAPLLGALVRRMLAAGLGARALRDADLEGEPPRPEPELPDRSGGGPGTPRAELLGEALALPRTPGPYASWDDYTEAYRAGTTTPEEVAERAIERVRADAAADPPLRPLIAQHVDEVRREGAASAARWVRGAPLSPLDGAPVAVKDELEVQGYPTTLGTRSLGAGRVAGADAAAVARLRALGCLVIGKANMHELGLGVTGLNPHHGAARNPHDPARAPGGSSSGSAVAVAAGLAPVALGADGGGSIRIPASLCGVFGFKPTFGRVPLSGVAPLCYSVAHAGPLAASARDLALAYALIAGHDEGDPASLRQPPPSLEGIGETDLAGIRVGIDRGWFEDADDDVVARCDAALEHLRALGVERRDVEVGDREMMRVAHAVTITGEGLAAASQHRRRRRELGLDVRVSLAVADEMRASDYVQAQRVRGRACRSFGALFEGVDLLATPATACTAPPHRARALRTGESDHALLERLMRFAHPFNLTGHPAISIPVGHDSRGLPVGLQLVARPWDEALLLRAALLLEPRVERHEPARRLDLLPSAEAAR